mmetsp:Transcript_13741/g.34845  ORF Transcript_13741/g.34845 Transcript_13741/m.34845 type:complete len:572 (+) Transcript_13741:65-1780(+)
MALRSHALDRKYVFEYDVGLWAFGTIQVLRDRESNELKTCKTVQKAMIRNPPEAVARLHRLRELQHEHISGITDVIEDQARIYVVSDKCQGGDLAEWIVRVQDEGNWLQEHIVAEYIRQTLIALHHGHGSRIWHRDLRPSSLVLTSKLPDAKVKIADFGLADIFDPLNENAVRMRSPYSAPEVAHSFHNPGSPSHLIGPAADMFSVGAIAHQLLVGSPPPRQDEGGGAWAALSRAGANALSRDPDFDTWMDRSSLSRDFVGKLLRQQAEERPTAAAALQHPWMQGCFSLDPAHWNFGSEATNDLKNRLICYMLAVMILPAFMQYRDLFQLRSGFASSDHDRDGFVSRALAHRLLKERGATASHAAAALDAVDVTGTGVVDICAISAAYVIAHGFCSVEGEDRPRKPSDLVPRLLSGFFRTFGDAQRMVASVPSITGKYAAVILKEVELHLGVNYEELLSVFPDDDTFDKDGLIDMILEGHGHGTPLAAGDSGDENDGSENSWGETLSLGRVQDLMRGVFQTCGLGVAAVPCHPAPCEAVMRHSACAPPGWGGAGEEKQRSYKRIMPRLGGQ